MAFDGKVFDWASEFGFTIDGIALPEGTFSVERMPAGVHKLAVSQERPFGLYEAVHDIEIVEEKENRIDISLPDIVGEEIDLFTQADKYLMFEAMQEGTVVASNLNDLNGLLETMFFQEFRSGLVQKYDRWVKMMDGEVRSLNETKHFNVSFIERSLWDSEKKKHVFNRAGSLSSQYRLFLLNKEQPKSENIFVPDIKTIIIDGKSDDWVDVSPAIIDAVGDPDVSKIGSSKACDLVEARLAIDSDNLYVMIRSDDGKYIKDRLVHKIHFKCGVGNLYFDFHLATEDKLYVGWDRNSKDTDNSWDSMAQSVKFRVSNILEVSIPLKKFIDSPIFLPEMRMHIGYSYAPPQENKHYSIDKMDNIPDIIFPLLELMVKKDEI